MAYFALGIYLLLTAAVLRAAHRRGNLSAPLLLLVTGATVIPVSARKLGIFTGEQSELASVGLLSIALVVSLVQVKHVTATIDSVDIAVSLIVVTSIVAWILNSVELSEKNMVRWILELAPVIVALSLRHLQDAGQMIWAIRFVALTILIPSVLLGILGDPFAFSGIAGPAGGQVSERLSGLLGHSNSLGTISVIAGGVALADRSLRASVPSLGIALAAGFMSGQRSAFVPLVALTILLVTRAVAGHLASRARPVAYIASGILVTLSLPFAVGRLNSLVDERQASVEGRSIIWQYTLENADRFLPIGLGPRGLYELTSRISLGEEFFHAHNQILTWFTIAGIPAIIATLVLFSKLSVSLVSGWGISTLPISIALLPPFILESPFHVGFTSQTVATAALSWSTFFILLPAAHSGDRTRV